MIATWFTLALLTFDPAATGKALVHPQGRGSALRELLSLSAPDLAAARAARVSALVAAVAGDPTVEFADRVLAVRALALLGGGDGVPALSGMLRGATPQETALALEAARALRQLGAVAALVPALGHPDPEVRSMAAAAGAGGAALCGLLKDDPWPGVRAAAARGLMAHPEHAACLAEALSDEPRVAVAAAQSAGEAVAGEAVGNALVGPLKALAGNARAPVEARAEALVSLARLGELAPAQTVLRTHLSKGGIEPLALGAVRAFANDGSEATLLALRRALGSKSPTVRLLAATALSERGDQESVPAIRALREAVPEHRRADVDRALERLGVAPSLELDPADSDPE